MHRNGRLLRGTTSCARSRTAWRRLLGHARLETTLIYLRRKDKATAMEAVRDLSWSPVAFSESEGKAHTGFEPVPPP